MKEKYVKITKQAHAFKYYASSYNIEILNYFDPELQQKNIESTIKNKLKKLLFELKGFEFVAKLVLLLEKIKCEDKTKCDKFYSHLKA